MMRRSWLVFILFVLAVLAPGLPVAAQSSCAVRTKFIDMPLRAGPGTGYAIVRMMRPRTDYQVIERALETLANGRTRIWYHLVPDSTGAEVWVGGRVELSGDCESLPTGSALPPASSPSALMPSSDAGNWSVVNYSHTFKCADASNKTIFSETDALPAYGNARVVVAGETFTVLFDDETIKFTKGRDGLWRGVDRSREYERGESYAVTLRVESATHMSGEATHKFLDEEGLKCAYIDLFTMVLDAPTPAN